MSKKVRISLSRLFSREVKDSGKENIYNNGADNNYPERMERTIDSSVTAKMASAKMADFIEGLGFADGEDIINEKKRLTYNDILSMVAREVSRQKGFFIHVNYDESNKVNYLDVLPFKNCRISKEDDKEYPGLIYHSKNWGNSAFRFKRSENKKSWFYPYNPNPDVIKAQRIRDAREAKSKKGTYRGQVLFVNLEPEKRYPLAYVDVCQFDADAEYRSALYKNTSLRDGFLGKTIAVLSEDLDDKDFKAAEENLQTLLGAENTGSLLTIDGKTDADGLLQPTFKIEPIQSNVDDKLFAYTESSAQAAILKAFKNIPSALVDSGKGALFSPSGDALDKMIRFYQSETEKERQVVERTFKMLFPDQDFEILTLVNTEDTETVLEQEKAKAQGKLRGSFEGVNSIIALQAAVADGATTREAGIATLIHMYGFEQSEAEEMITDGGTTNNG